MKLDEDEIVIFEPKRNLYTKILNSICLAGSVYLLAIIMLQAILNNQVEFMFLTIILFFTTYRICFTLFSKILLTNKRVLYQNIFYHPKSICLKDIEDINIDYGTYTTTILLDLQNIRDIEFKILGKLLKKRILIADPDEFKEKTLEYIKEKIKDNNLSHNLI